ncbi:putative f-box and wd domain-containing protein [Botrytis fragariae]|uniref:Putative f-box and wd domain-containing protein n=1 Tax=Botrytis fragariae TaxID=1964551 RepID=A0A8H6ASK7_9HELO|nr:putative f-box and wd domain-containing protein [Botrytis fragariae]KAF5872680.1 putative f-box and wd domain-containing protein [Botrytis fragariae]
MLYHGSIFIWIFILTKCSGVFAQAKFQQFPNSTITSTSYTTQVNQSSIFNPKSVLYESPAESSSIHSDIETNNYPSPTLSLPTSSWTNIGTTRHESSANPLAVTTTPQWPGRFSGVTSDTVPVSNPTSQWPSNIKNVTSIFTSTLNSTSRSQSFITSTTFALSTNFGYPIAPTNSRQLINNPNTTIFSFHHQTVSSFGHSETGTFSNTIVNTSVTPPELDLETDPCIALDSPDDDYYEFILVPNTKTITLASNATYTPIPEFTPPTYCPPGTSPAYELPTFPFGNDTDPNLSESNETSTGEYLTLSPLATPSYSQIRTTTVVVTSKNPQVVIASYTPPRFPGVPVTKIGKPSTPNFTSSSTPGSSGKAVGPESNSVGNPDAESNNDSGSPSLSTTSVVVLGVPIVLTPSNVVINGHTIQRQNSPLTIKQKGHIFTVNPSQVIGPETTLTLPSSYRAIESTNPATTRMQSQPNPTSASGTDSSGKSPTLTTNLGGNIEMSAISTVVDNISVKLGESIAVVNGKSYSIGSGAPQVVTVINTQTITIGIAGVQFTHTTLAPLLVEPTNHVIIGGEPISVGNSLAYIGSSTFTYGSGLAIQTDVFNGQTICIYPSGVVFARTTLGGNSRSGNQIGIVGGLSVTELGSSIAIISSITFNIGPGATPTKTVISGESISADQSGLVLAGTTLTYPLILATHPVTISDVIFTQIGSSLAVIDGTTLTFGPGATPTSHTFNRQTIKIGSNGIEFSKTTFTGVSESSSMQAMPTSTSKGSKFKTTGEDSTHTSTSTAATSTDQESDAGKINAPFEIYGCITLGLIMMMT